MEPRTRVLSNWGPMIGLCAKSMLSATTLVVFGIKIKIKKIFFVPSLQLESAIVWCMCRKVPATDSPSWQKICRTAKLAPYDLSEKPFPCSKITQIIVHRRLRIIHPFWQVVLFVSPISWLKLTNQTIRRFN